MAKNRNNRGEQYHNYRHEWIDDDIVVANDNGQEYVLRNAESNGTSTKIIYNDKFREAKIVTGNITPVIEFDNSYYVQDKTLGRGNYVVSPLAESEVSSANASRNKSSEQGSIKRQIFDETYRLLGIKAPTKSEVEIVEIKNVENDRDNKDSEVALDDLNAIKDLANKQEQEIKKEENKIFEEERREEVNYKELQKDLSEQLKKELNQSDDNILKAQRLDQIFVKASDPNLVLFKETAPIIDATKRVGSVMDLGDTRWEKVKDYVKEFNTKTYAEMVGNVPGIIDVDNALKVDLNDKFYLSNDQLTKLRNYQTSQFNDIINEYYEVLEKQQTKQLQEAFNKINSSPSVVFNNEKNVELINKQNDVNLSVLDENIKLKQEIRELEAKLLQEAKVPVIEKRMSRLELEDSLEVLEPEKNKKSESINVSVESSKNEAYVNIEKQEKNSLDDLLKTLNMDVEDTKTLEEILNNRVVNVYSKDDLNNKVTQQNNNSESLNINKNQKFDALNINTNNEFKNVSNQQNNTNNQYGQDISSTQRLLNESKRLFNESTNYKFANNKSLFDERINNSNVQYKNNMNNSQSTLNNNQMFNRYTNNQFTNNQQNSFNVNRNNSNININNMNATQSTLNNNQMFNTNNQFINSQQNAFNNRNNLNSNINNMNNSQNMLNNNQMFNRYTNNQFNSQNAFNTNRNNLNVNINNMNANNLYRNDMNATQNMLNNDPLFNKFTNNEFVNNNASFNFANNTQQNNMNANNMYRNDMNATQNMLNNDPLFNKFTNNEFANNKWAKENNETDNYIRSIKAGQINSTQQNIHNNLANNNSIFGNNQFENRNAFNSQMNSFSNQGNQIVNVDSQNNFKTLVVGNKNDNRSKVILNTLKRSRGYAQSSSHINNSPFNISTSYYNDDNQDIQVMSLADACKLKKRPY